MTISVNHARRHRAGAAWPVLKADGRSFLVVCGPVCCKAVMMAAQEGVCSEASAGGTADSVNEKPSTYRIVRADQEQRGEDI